MSTRWLALLALTSTLVLALSCAGLRSRPQAEKSPPLPGAGHPHSDLVSVQGSVLQMDHFLRCELGDGDDLDSIQLLMHSEAPVGEISRDRFVARSVLALDSEVRALARDSSSGFAEPHCHEVEAPEGDVGWEISLAVSATGVETHVQPVEVRGATQPTASQGTAQCQRGTMGDVFCCAAPNGVAVKDNLGNVRCARGQCVSTPMGEWQCSRAAGGWAELDPRGEPVCQQGCYSPSSTQCRRM